MIDNTDQLTRDALAGMSPEQIEAARLAGRLDALMGAPAELVEARRLARNLEPVTREQVRLLMRARDHDLVSAYSKFTDRITD